ncbi:hypothetical protein MHUMG1_02206 [Metarhizium humberi]|uniref:Uncharacterized protein n=1 Tax=Metarhizium humberi TaxID=2596975 RepID=A0A9P8SAL0_9HYPO|nr:hypothetical protein MHUMG1_02206 [Metarhizium humberi]
MSCSFIPLQARTSLPSSQYTHITTPPTRALILGNKKSSHECLGILDRSAGNGRRCCGHPPEEKQEWESCTNNLIYAYNHGAARVETSCVFWECLDTNTNKYHRGGGITLSNIISSVCLAIIQWLWDLHTAPKPSRQEVEDCTCGAPALEIDLIKTFDTPASGNEAA